jgi:hypothetical protein
VDLAAAGLVGRGRRGIVLIGVPIFATIGTCLGVLGWDPLARPAPAHPLGLGRSTMLLAGVYGVAVAKGAGDARAGRDLMRAGLPLWQRVRDRLP